MGTRLFLPLERNNLAVVHKKTGIPLVSQN